MGKQKTDEEFKKEFYDKFPNSSVNIIGNYINARTKIECKCKKCNLEWNTIPDNLLKNTGCPKCAKTKYNTESFKEKYYKKYPETNVLIMGEYIRNDIKIKCKCKKCGWEWSTRPNVLDSGSGCPKCAGTFRYATESFKKTYYKRFPNSNIMIVGEYVNTITPIACECKVCGWKWSTKPNSLIQNKGCPQCNNKMHYTTELFKEVCYKRNSDSKIEIIGDYVNFQTSIKCKCRVCNYEWNASPRKLRNGVKCPSCIGKVKYDTESFIRKFYENNPDSQIIITGEYVNSNSGITCRCLSCGCEWKPVAGSLIAGHGCPRCASTRTEKSFGTFLNSLGISYTTQKKFEDCRNINPLSFDYEINDERFITFLLEYQGEQHKQPVDFAGKGEMWANEQFEYNQIRDQIKYDYCQKTGYHLEYIWYYEEDKIQVLINLLRKYIKPEYDLDKILANAKIDKTA